MDDIMIYYRQQTKFAGVMFLRVSVSRSVHGEGVCSKGGACFGGVPAPGRGVPARGICSRGGGGGVETPRDGYCCERYASYWNAFLFIIKLP